jgi:hypothetical protein
LSVPENPQVYVADPFGSGSCDDILVEVFDQRTQKGVIRAIDSASGAIAVGDPVLPDEVHASYPYIVTHDSEIYCLPEVARARGVRLFRARRFPGDWEDLGILVPDVAAVDPTVVHHDGRWWLFFTDKDVDSNAALHLWHAPELLGPWEPHTSNPIKTDVRSSRPAGTPFVHDGKLFRPAQDCSSTYGGAIALNEVEVLTPNRFRERVVHVIGPAPRSPYPAGCHTLSAMGPQTLIDGKRRVFAGTRAGAAIFGKARRGLARKR